MCKSFLKTVFNKCYIEKSVKHCIKKCSSDTAVQTFTVFILFYLCILCRSQFSPKNENYHIIYSTSSHPIGVSFSSFRRIQSELYYKYKKMSQKVHPSIIKSAPNGSGMGGGGLIKALLMCFCKKNIPI